MRKYIFISILIASLSTTLMGCEKEAIRDDVIDQKEVIEENVEENAEENNKEELKMNQLEMPKQGEEVAVLSTNMGDIKIRLFPEAAPKAVENFETHIKNGYYDGLTFHRVMDGFMIQGGDPTGIGIGGESIWGKPFEDEFHKDYRNFRGALSMANSGPNTNGSQFFIVQAKEMPNQVLELLESGSFSEEIKEAYKSLGGTPWLDGGHTVFGQVYDGMEVVDAIAKVKTDGNDKPLEEIVIKEAKIVTVD